MGHASRPSRADTLKLMRHLADVAALRTDPPAQRQLLADGLNRLFNTTLGWMFAFDNARPDRPLHPVMAVLAGDQRPVWQRYCADFATNVGAIQADFYADAILRSNAPQQQWRRPQLLAKPEAYRRYAPALQVVREARIGDGAVCVWRCGPQLNRVVGFSLHRSEEDPHMTERDYALHRLALSELRRLAQRGHLPLEAPPVPALPSRLRQVLDGLLEGQSPKQVARDLGLSVWTVREHVQRLYVRFGINSREELMAKFVVRDLSRSTVPDTSER